MKRFLSTLLMICMLISLFPAVALAEEIDSVPAEGEEEIVADVDADAANVDADAANVDADAADVDADAANDDADEVNDDADAATDDADAADAPAPAEPEIISGGTIETVDQQDASNDPIVDSIELNDTNFPDANFLAFVSSPTINTTADTVLTVAELTAVTTMDVSGQSIESLTGIGFFSKLTELDASDNKLTALDLRDNVELTKLDCHKNKLTSLNLTGCEKLEELDCSDNQLSSVDIESATKLEDLVHDKTVNRTVNGNGDYQHVKGAVKLVYDQSTAMTHMPLWDDGKVTTEASCSATGVKTFTCTRCTRTKTEEIPMADHLWDDGEVTTPPTASTEGLRTYHCQRCTATKTEKIPKTSLTGGLELISANVPDAALRAMLQDASRDTNGDNYLDTTEIAAIKTLDCSGKSIQYMRGVEHLTALETLICSDNQISTLDLTKNVALKTLNCSNNKLSALDLTKNVELQHLICSQNSIASMDLSKNTKLIDLACESNKLTALDLSKNTELTVVSCASNQLSSINLSGCAKLATLTCSNNKLTALDVTKCTLLNELYCEKNSFTALNNDKNTNLLKLVHQVEKSTKNGVTSYDGTAKLRMDATVTLSHTPTWDAGVYKVEADKPNCKTHKDGLLTHTCTVSGCTETKTEVVPFAHQWEKTGEYSPAPTSTNPGKELERCKVCEETRLVDVPALQDGIPVDEAHFPDETFRTYVKNNIDTDKSLVLSEAECNAVTSLPLGSVTSLTGVAYFPELTELSFTGTVSTADLSKNVKLTVLDAHDTALTALDLSSNTQLEQLYCYNTLFEGSLATLNISQCTKLIKLFCFGNRISSLDLTRLLALQELDCSGNNLSSLNLAPNTALKFVDCSGNAISSLSLGSNSNLIKLQAMACPISSLDLKGVPNIKILDVQGTKLKSLDLSQTPTLSYTYVSGTKGTVAGHEDEIVWYTIDPVTVAANRIARMPYGVNGLDSTSNQMLQFTPGLTIEADSYAVIESRSLYLKDSIGLNFYISLPDNYKIVKGQSHVDIEGETLEIPAPIASSGFYLFTYYITAKQMRDEVTVKLYDSNGKLFPLKLKDGDIVTEGYKFSAQKYFDLAKEKLASDAKLMTLLDRTSDYGYLAQNYFDYHPVTLTAQIISSLNTVSLSSLTGYKPTITGEADGGVTYSGSTLELKSATRLRHVFALQKGAIGDYTFLVDGTAVTPLSKADDASLGDKQYAVDIKGVAAKDLGTVHLVQVKDSSGNVICKIENYSPISYAYRVLEVGGGSGAKAEQLVNLVKGLYLYHQAAKAYF